MSSAYQAYLDEGGDDQYLSVVAHAQDLIDPNNSVSLKTKWHKGDIFRIRVRKLGDVGIPHLIYTLKLGYKDYRFGHTIEQLEHAAMLHGVYKEG